MSGYINGANISDIYHGNDYIETVYKGNELIFDNSDILKKYLQGSSTFVIPKETTVMRKWCFCHYNTLKTVKFEEPCQLQELPLYCFYGCTSLQSLMIPNSIKRIPDYMCMYCSSLSEVIFEEGFEFEQTNGLNHVFAECSTLENIILPDTTPPLGNGCFYGCSSLESINLPHSITSLGIDCFCVCKSLQSIVIPNSVTSLGSECFYVCGSLSNVSFEEPCQIKELPQKCFGYCPIIEITIPSSITTIDTTTFVGCDQLTTIYVDKPTDSISGAPWGAKNATVIWSDNSHYPEKPQPY